MKPAETVEIALLLERVGRLFATDNHADGLLPVHWETLRYLSRANRFSRSHSALTAYLGLTKGTVSTTLSTLENKGLIRKDPADGDRRGKRLALTSTGAEKLAQDPAKIWAEQISELTEEHAHGLSEGLRALIDGRLARQNRAPFGLCRSCIHFVDHHASGNPHYCSLLQTPLNQDDPGLICAEQAQDTSARKRAKG